MHVANALGTANPVAEVVRLAHTHGAAVLLDGAQAVAHMPVDVRVLGCDFYVFSGHKIFGPTGIGVLYGRAALLDATPPYRTGGGMIATVTLEQTTYAEPPYRFEAGTPHIEGAVGLGAALEYVESLGFDWIESHEGAVLRYGLEALSHVRGLNMIGDPRARAGILALELEGVHAHDVATVLDRFGVTVRAGHHCCQPLMARLGVPATVRVSCALYNTCDEIDALVNALDEARTLFR